MDRKRSDMTIAHRVLGDSWSRLLSDHESFNVIRGTIEPHCMMFNLAGEK